MRIIDVIEQGIDPYTDFAALLRRVADPLCRVIISNTTEAGSPIAMRKQRRSPVRQASQAKFCRAQAPLPDFGRRG